ncbi:hypothetical protein QYE76_063795 [Lolium multiflorum]|uniref:Transposase (putative) gypsy type domain-containing protein n=1 Tax=Lolium multiflorum TaxID=4521 RepID=A0AAD8S7R3_LOLMU|nr:hypothetical protein QYE76_063795 [Lolium multiflorum]
MAAEDLEWERSKISNQDVNTLKRLGLMKKEDAIRFPSEESYPNPPMEYRVSFVDHLIRGLSAPIHDFLRGLLFVYGIQLHQLTPNSILHISIFITLCECFLGIPPNWVLWKRIFCLRRNGSHNATYNIGGVVICVRTDVDYFDVKFPDSVQGWRKRWLYIHEESANSVEHNIIPFDGSAKIQRRRSWDAEASDEEKKATEALMSLMTRKKYASRAEEKLAEANKRADALAQKLEQSAAACKKAELVASEAKAEADDARAKAASVEELQKKLEDAVTALDEHKAAQASREQGILKRLKSQSRRTFNQTNQEFDLSNPVDDPLIDALSYLELHGSEIREGVANANAGLSALFPYFFPKKEEPSTFLNLAKMFNSPEDLGLKMRQENMKIALVFDNYTASSAPSNVSPSSPRSRRTRADLTSVEDSLPRELDELRQQLQSMKKQTLVMMEKSRKSSEAEEIALQQAREAVAAKEIAASEAEKATIRENFMLELMKEASADLFHPPISSVFMLCFLKFSASLLE